MPSPAADRNLVFGLLALQMEFVSGEQLIDAMNAWMLHKSTPLGQILRERGVLSDRRVALLEELVEEHVNQHGGAQASLGAGLWAVGREEARTRRALAEAQANLTLAQDNLALARRAVDECFNVAREHPVFQTPRMEQARKLLLEKTLPYYSKFRSQRPDDPGLQRQQAEQFFRVGYIESVLGHDRESAQAYRQARDILVELVQVHPEVPDYQSDLTANHGNLASMLSHLGKSEQALEEYAKARDIGTRLVKANPQRALGSPGHRPAAPGRRRGPLPRPGQDRSAGQRR
jgi:tetratricopeptide (TPR) repeat protein